MPEAERGRPGRQVSIDVITIARNAANEIEATITSTLTQSYPRVAYIIIDGASSDGTVDVIRRFAERHPGRIQWRSEPDLGIADAFNKGLALARGDAVLFLNAGDRLLDPGYLARAAARLAAHPEESFVHGAIEYEDGLAGTYRAEPSSGRIGRGMPYWHQTMVVRRDLFDQLGGFDVTYRIAMDYDFACRMSLAGCRGWYAAGPPVVAMEGRGVSAMREWQSIGESARALWRNRLLGPGEIVAFSHRFSAYLVRRALLACGMRRLLIALKHLKYGRVE